MHFRLFNGSKASNTTNMDQSMTMDTLGAMRRQEASNYRKPTGHLTEGKLDGYPVDFRLYLEWRRRMIVWNYSIATTCKYEKETVEMAVSIVDRFVAVQTELLTQAHRYQVACMASLYIAAKIQEPQCLAPDQMETLSGGRLRAYNIEDMEREILTAIQWRVNPPTATAFCRTFLDLVPSSMVPDRQTVLDIVESHIQVAIVDEYFLSVDASSLGFASLMNALQCVHGDSNLSQFFGYFSKALLNDDFKHSIQHTSPEVDRLRRKLRALAVESLSSGLLVNEAMAIAYQKQQSHDKGHSKTPSNKAWYSPRSVMGGHRSVGVLL